MSIGAKKIPGNFSDNVRAARTSKGLSQRELAEKLGVAVSQVTKWESGQSDSPRLGTIAKLAAALQVKPTDLSDTPEVHALELQISKQSLNPGAEAIDKLMVSEAHPESGIGAEDRPARQISVPTVRVPADTVSRVTMPVRTAQDITVCLSRLDRALSDANRAITEANSARLEIQRLLERA